MINKTVLIIVILVLSNILSAQNTINQTDEKGFKQGKWVVKDKQGIIKYKGQFNNDVPYGEFTYYYKSGSVKAISRIFNDGQSSYTKTFHKNGNMLAEGKYVNRKKDSVWNYYANDKDKRLVAVEAYKNNSKHGTWKSFYSNGNVAEEITYIKGVKEGLWKQYFEDGSIKFKVPVKNGLKEGLFTSYFPGQAVVNISGTYSNGVKQGIWMYFNQKAEKTRRETYENGILVDVQTFEEEN